MKKRIERSVLFFMLGGLLLCSINQFPLPLLSQTQEKPLQYEIEVVLIEIPLYVVDGKGNPVKDLKPEELVLYEKGKEQKISHFVLVENDSPQISSLIREYPAARRQFLLFYDFAFATPARINKARQASLTFVEEKILPNDLVAVATYSAMGGLKFLSNFSSDREHLFNIIDTLGLVESSQRMSGPLGYTFPDFVQSSQDFLLRSEERTTMGDAEFFEILERAKKKTERENEAHVSDFIGDLNKLSLALNSIKGRKHVIYFSEGFDSKFLTGKTLNELSQDTEEFASNRGVPTADTDARFGNEALRMKLYDALKRIASADCPIHTVDIGGLRTQSGSLRGVEGSARDLSGIRRGQDTLTLLARETGGQVYKNVNELDEPLENLLKVTNTYYIIGYYPEEKKKEGKYREIKIKTSRKDVDISYRKGYYEPKPFEKYSNLEKRLQLIEYIVNDIPQSDILFDSLVSTFRGKEDINPVAVFMKFPGGQFLEEKKKKIELEIYGYAISSAGLFKDFFHQTINISPQKVKERLETHGIKYFDLHLVPAGDYKIKLIVRDRKTGVIGSQIQEIHVPDYERGELGVSGPVFIEPESGWVLSRGYDPKNPAGRKKGDNLPIDYPYVIGNKSIIPGVLPLIRRESPAHFYFRAYNLMLNTITKAPQTEMSFAVVDMEGNRTPYKAAGIVKAPIQEDPSAYDFVFEANFGDFPSGLFQLEVTFKDSLSKQRSVSSAFFILQ